VLGRATGLDLAMCSWRKITYKQLPLATVGTLNDFNLQVYSIQCETEMLSVLLIVIWIFSIVTSFHLTLLFPTHVFTGMYVCFVYSCSWFS